MKPAIGDRRGIALVMTLLLALVVAGMAFGIILMSGRATTITRFQAREAEMQSAADAALEWARDTLNGGGAALPATGFDTLENGVAVRDASGAVIPGYLRWVYAGRSGNVTGQYGVYASTITEIRDDATRRAVVVRRLELNQESFAKFARFDDRTVSTTVFMSGIQVFGPLHTNQTLYVGTGATFHGPVSTAATVDESRGVPTYRQGKKERVPVIPMPTPAELATLRGFAVTGQTVVTGGALGTTYYTPATRIEFVPVDLNADGDYTDEDEGFIRVYGTGLTTTNALNYVTARFWSTGSDPNAASPNCGDWAGPTGSQTFMTAASHTNATASPHNHSTTSTLANQRASLNSAGRACYLGGDPRLTGGFAATTPAPGNYGSWVAWPGWGAGAPSRIQNGTVHPSFGGGTVGAMANYLWPINRPYNLNFKGVVYVDGSVAVSGVVRGQVTVASTGNIMLADDITYVTSPGSIDDCFASGATFADALGLLTPQFFMIDDNSVNSPFQVNGTFVKGFDETGDENIHAAVLTLNSVSSEALGTGSLNAEVCAGTNVGRGCLNWVGAVIQGINAPRMQSGSGGNTGWNPQWTFDRCMGRNPPPYFPTTGRYSRNRYYEMDPVDFDVTSWFATNQ